MSYTHETVSLSVTLSGSDPNVWYFTQLPTVIISTIMLHMCETEPYPHFTTNNVIYLYATVWC